MTTNTRKRPKDEQVHCSPAAKAFIKKQAWKKRKSQVQIVDDLCFPKGIPIKGSVS